ncbi:hypothetical protein E2C01_076709 [Portunus trituberculatus]|uniref:Secreted protein n=1 Tax=Portunus trituberculatus TaxID=210409 RepID=A0A5B7IPD6_PORTR|nr:hypothetical protein [Portunus trituberculatus]
MRFGGLPCFFPAVLSSWSSWCAFPPLSPSSPHPTATEWKLKKSGFDKETSQTVGKINSCEASNVWRSVAVKEGREAAVTT